MRTAYDALHRAVVKNFGKWYAFQWIAVNKEMRSRIQNDNLAETFWRDIFLSQLSELWLHSGPNGEIRINGKLNGGWSFDSEYEQNIRRLEEFKAECKYWVYSSYCFNENFVLYGFRTKEEALLWWKVQKSRIDTVYSAFWFRW